MIQTGVVQGIEKAIARYEKKGTIYFALYCGNDKYPVVNGLNGRWDDISECVEELKEYFDDITPDHKKIYQILWYEASVKPDAKGKINDVPEGSVKFVTLNHDQIQTYVQDYRERGEQYRANRDNELASRIAALESAKKIDDNEEDYEDEKPVNALMGLVQNPDVVNFIVGTVQTIIDRILPPKKTIAGIAGIEDDSKLNKALEILRKHDPQLEDDLMILAEMAENSPLQFKMLLNMLRK
jgi:hypothetical protein